MSQDTQVPDPDNSALIPDETGEIQFETQTVGCTQEHGS